MQQLTRNNLLVVGGVNLIKVINVCANQKLNFIIRRLIYGTPLVRSEVVWHCFIALDVEIAQIKSIIASKLKESIFLSAALL